MLVNNRKGRTAMTWTLCKVCCVVRGATVRGDGMGACARGREHGGERAEGGGINGNSSEVNMSLLRS
jgi:hypothetical protein